MQREEDGQRNRSTGQLLKGIATDTGTLIRKEVELARQEVMEGVAARMRGMASLATAGILALFGLVFGGLAGADALSNRWPAWLARLVVAGAFLVLALLALVIARVMARSRPLMPEETKRTVKEDVQWARAQLRR